MTTRDNQLPGPVDSLDAADTQQVLDDLQDTIGRLLEDSRTDRMADAPPAVERIDELLMQLTGMTRPTSRQIRQLKLLAGLHSQLQLTLAQKKDEASRRLADALRGHNGLKAYRNAISADTAT